MSGGVPARSVFSFGGDESHCLGSGDAEGGFWDGSGASYGGASDVDGAPVLACWLGDVWHGSSVVYGSGGEMKRGRRMKKEKLEVVAMGTFDGVTNT